jgi:tetratricopeptide (TPR) repeat protein
VIRTDRVRADDSVHDGGGDLPAELRVPLRLTVTRGALGLELYEPIEFGPLSVRRLAVTWPGLRFPVDLSGGVKVFRHRRGRLLHLQLEVGLDALARTIHRRVREMLGGLVRPVSVWKVNDGIGVGLVGTQGAVAFDLLWAPVEGDARLVVSRPRGAELDGSALTVALQVVDTVMGRFARREGRIVTVEGAAATITRLVMPAVGARAPSATELRAGELESDGDAVRVEFDSALPPPALTPNAVRALELAMLTKQSDDALARGDLEAARSGYVSALEQAPRHPELSRLVAEIDALSGGRAEGALAMLTEALPAAQAGVIGATLLARVGDVVAAREALRAATRDEDYAPLSSLLWASLAAREDDAHAKALALDEAVARAPGLAPVRWARFEARLAQGDVKGALSDAEHLEGGASGSALRHEVCRKAGQRLLELGYVRDAGRVFERALRYVPDDATATAGLGHALLETGKGERAIVLLERAIALAEQRGEKANDALMTVAKLLSRMEDLPQAIARARQVEAPSARVFEARALEAEWREKLGDLTGATLAHARLRESIETAELRDPQAVKAAVEWLRAAAAFEGTVRKDLALAERHLAAALRLAPRDRAVGDAYREAAALLAARER